MKIVVPEITPTSSFHDLTLSLSYSFQGTERKMVEDILTNRENLLKDEIKKSKQILDQMLKEKASFAALLKKEVQDAIQKRVDVEEKMKETCHVLEEEVESLREKCEYLIQSRVELEEKMKENCGVLEKEVQSLRDKCEELRRETGFACLMKEKSDALEREGELKRRVLEEEVESLRRECEKLKRDCGFMENTISLDTVEKIQVEEEVRSQPEILENQNDVLQGFKKELENMRESHNQGLKRNNEIMKKKLSLGVSEKLQLEEELEKSRMRSEEARKELEGELEKVRKSYEEELKRERDFAALSKMEVENLMQGRVEFEEKMKNKYDVLAKELELKRNILEEEVKSLRKRGEELKSGSDLMENMLSLQKRQVEDERRLQREMLENQNDVLQKGFKKELEKMRECHHEELERNHDMMEKKLSLCLFEKMQLEEKLEKSLMQNEEARKELEGEVQKARETYEDELKREREFAALSKMEVENLMQSRVEFEEKMKEKYDAWKSREEKQWWEEVQKYATRPREGRTRKTYEKQSRMLEEQDRLNEIRRFEETIRIEREEEERQKARKKNKKKKPVFPQRRNDRRTLERERMAKRSLPDLGKYNAQYGSATKRRREGEVGLSNILLGILDTLKSRHEVSFLFLKPVLKKEAPDYYDIIKEPMDLSTIRDKVTRMIYKSHEDFRHDVCQIVVNAHRYNANRHPHIPPLADQLLKLCDYLLEENTSALADAEAGIEMDPLNCTL